MIPTPATATCVQFTNLRIFDYQSSMNDTKTDTAVAHDEHRPIDAISLAKVGGYESYGLVKSRYDNLSLPRTLWVFKKVFFVVLSVYTGYVCEGFEVRQTPIPRTYSPAYRDTARRRWLCHRQPWLHQAIRRWQRRGRPCSECNVGIHVERASQCRTDHHLHSHQLVRRSIWPQEVLLPRMGLACRRLHVPQHGEISINMGSSEALQRRWHRCASNHLSGKLSLQEFDTNSLISLQGIRDGNLS